MICLSVLYKTQEEKGVCKRGVIMTVCSILLVLCGLFSVLTSYVVLIIFASNLSIVSFRSVPDFLADPINGFAGVFLSETAWMALPSLCVIATLILTIVNIWNAHVSGKLRAALVTCFAGVLLTLLPVFLLAAENENSVGLRALMVLCLLFLTAYAVLMVVNTVQTVAD